MIDLPTKISEPLTRNPQFMIIYSRPKAGKTTAFSLLENNLIIDLEEGSDFVGGLKIKANSATELQEIKNALIAKKEKGEMYDYITFDTATALEEISGEIAIKLYQNTPMGKDYGKKKGEDDLKKLPSGAGYLYLREAFLIIINQFKPLAKKCLILSGHVNDKLINRNGTEMSEMSFDLTGKLSRIVSSRADAIGLLYRKGNHCILNFNGGDDVVIEARAEHLTGKEIILTEKTNNGFISHWDEIFIGKLEKTK